MATPTPIRTDMTVVRRLGLAPLLAAALAGCGAGPRDSAPVPVPQTVLRGRAGATSAGGAGVVMADMLDASTTLTQVANRELSGIAVPAGFNIRVIADGLAGARAAAVSPAGRGDLVVALGDSLVALWGDDDGDGAPDRRTVFQSGLDGPSGVAFGPDDDYLYFAERDRLSRVPYMAGETVNRHRIQVIARGLTFADAVTSGPSDRPAGGPRAMALVGGDSFFVGGMAPAGGIRRFDTNGQRADNHSGLAAVAGLAAHPKTKDLFAVVATPGGDIVNNVRAGQNSGSTSTTPALAGTGVRAIRFADPPPDASKPFPAPHADRLYLARDGAEPDIAALTAGTGGVPEGTAVRFAGPFPPETRWAGLAFDSTGRMIAVDGGLGRVYAIEANPSFPIPAVPPR